jgi:hypothetical protein
LLLYRCLTGRRQRFGALDRLVHHRQLVG